MHESSALLYALVVYLRHTAKNWDWSLTDEADSQLVESGINPAEICTEMTRSVRLHPFIPAAALTQFPPFFGNPTGWRECCSVSVAIRGWSVRLLMSFKAFPRAGELPQKGKPIVYPIKYPVSDGSQYQMPTLVIVFSHWAMLLCFALLYFFFPFLLLFNPSFLSMWVDHQMFTKYRECADVSSRWKHKLNTRT